MTRMVKFQWQGLELCAIGSGRPEAVVAKSLARRLKQSVTLWNGDERKNHFVAKYCDGHRFHEDDVLLVL